ncbi:MAG: hypothetical protein AB7O81_21520 [Blastocatellales bacterium]
MNGGIAAAGLFFSVMRMEVEIPLPDLTGRGVRVVIVDSGVNPAHPHVAGIGGGVCGGC